MSCNCLIFPDCPGPAALHRCNVLFIWWFIVTCHHAAHLSQLLHQVNETGLKFKKNVPCLTRMVNIWTKFFYSLSESQQGDSNNNLINNHDIGFIFELSDWEWDPLFAPILHSGAFYRLDALLINFITCYLRRQKYIQHSNYLSLVFKYKLSITFLCLCVSFCCCFT